MKNIYVILLEPEKSGNVGGIARLMANFDLSNLILVKPKCDHLNIEAIARAKHGGYVLKKAKVVNKIPKLDYVVGTTARLGRDYNIPRIPISPDKFASIINLKNSVGILFGREGKGLSNEEIKNCDFVVTIDASKKYPTMNIAHSAAIVFYEIYKKHGENKVSAHIAPATGLERKIMLKMFNQVLDKLRFSTKEKKETQRLVWKRFISRAFLSKREAFAVMGFFRKLLQRFSGK